MPTCRGRNVTPPISVSTHGSSIASESPSTCTIKTPRTYYAPLPNISGYTGQYKNVGAINNKGLEISLNADVIRTSKFQWTSDFNIGFNRNRVTELYGGKPELKGLKRLEEGRDMDEWYLREWAGVDPANGSPLWYTTDENGKRTTTDSYNKADRVYCGSAAPKFTGGWMNSIKVLH